MCSGFGCSYKSICLEITRNAVQEKLEPEVGLARPFPLASQNTPLFVFLITAQIRPFISSLCVVLWAWEWRRMKRRAGVRGGGGRKSHQGGGRRSLVKSQHLPIFCLVENLPWFTSAAHYGKIEPSNFTVRLSPACHYTCSQSWAGFFLDTRGLSLHA